MKPLPKLEFCCCGCTLRLGVQIIGFLGLIVALPSAINSLRGAPELPVNNQSPDAAQAAMVYNAAMEWYYVVNRIGSWTSVLFSALLLYGVFYENRAAVLSVAIINLIQIVLILLFGVGMAIAMKTFWIIFVVILVLLLPFYLTWVEYSYSEELRIQKENPQYCGKV